MAPFQNSKFGGVLLSGDLSSVRQSGPRLSYWLDILDYRSNPLYEYRPW